MNDAHRIRQDIILFFNSAPNIAANGIIKIAQAICHSILPSPSTSVCGFTHKRYVNQQIIGIAGIQKKQETAFCRTSLCNIRFIARMPGQN